MIIQHPVLHEKIQYMMDIEINLNCFQMDQNAWFWCKVSVLGRRE